MLVICLTQNQQYKSNFHVLLTFYCVVELVLWNTFFSQTTDLLAAESVLFTFFLTCCWSILQRWHIFSKADSLHGGHMTLAIVGLLLQYTTAHTVSILLVVSYYVSCIKEWISVYIKCIKESKSEICFFSIFPSEHLTLFSLQSWTSVKVSFDIVMLMNNVFCVVFGLYW